MTLATEQRVMIDFVVVDDTAVSLRLTDGRRVSSPLSWFPRLLHGTPAERNNWRLIGRGEGIHWPDLDEDLSLEGFVAGLRSGESKRSLDRWIAYRAKGQRVPVKTLPLPNWASTPSERKTPKRSKTKATRT